jgi:hypothetical protein
MGQQHRRAGAAPLAVATVSNAVGMRAKRMVRPLTVVSLLAGLVCGAAAAPEAFPVPTAEVRFTIAEQIWSAKVPTSPSGDAWLDGPLVHEFRSIVAPKNAQGEGHPFLRVYFDVRVYQDRATRLDVTVENVLDLDMAKTVTYEVQILAEGKTLFERKRVDHFYLTRWRQVFDLGYTPAEVRPDLAPFHAAKALPPYLSHAYPSARRAEGPRFDILKSADLNPNMPAHGGRVELGPYPDWAASYLVHRTASERDYMLRNGELAGSWPVHVREVDGSLVSIDKRPDFWFDVRAEDKPHGKPMPPFPYGPAPKFPQSPLIPDNAHVPSLAYIPYLMTGERYYMDEMAFWADYAIQATYQDEQNNFRHRGQGLMYCMEVRGFAWALRNIADAAAYLPDGHPLKKHFADKVANNLEWLDKHQAQHQTALGPAWFLVHGRIDFREDKIRLPLWQYNYLAWAVERANQHGFAGGMRWSEAIARFQLSLFTSPEYNRQNATPYRLRVGEASEAELQFEQPYKLARDKEIHFYPTLRELAAKTFETREEVRPIQGYYGVDARLMLLIGLRHGWQGAAEAYAWLNGLLRNDLARRQGWAIAASQSSPPTVPLPVYYLGAGWTTFGLALPQGVFKDALQVATLPTQTDVKTCWPDGSIRFAVVTVAAPRSDYYRLYPISH